MCLLTKSGPTAEQTGRARAAGLIGALWDLFGAFRSQITEIPRDGWNAELVTCREVGGVGWRTAAASKFLDQTDSPLPFLWRRIEQEYFSCPGWLQEIPLMRCSGRRTPDPELFEKSRVTVGIVIYLTFHLTMKCMLAPHFTLCIFSFHYSTCLS